MNNEEKLKEAKRLYQMANFDQRYVLESLFPELKESEDEKIRKYLLKLADRCPEDSIDFMRGVKKGDIIAWLEKQGEQKNVDYEHANIQQKDFAPKASTANRQVYNRAILAILSAYIEKYPDIRFGQMLCNLDVNPHFDEESKETYCNLNETINKSKDESKN